MLPFPNPLRSPSEAPTGNYVGGKLATNNWNTTSPSVISLTDLTGGIGSQPEEGDIVIIAYGEQGADPNMQVVTAGYTEIFDLHVANHAASNFGGYYKVMGAVPDTSVSLARIQTFTSGIIGIHVWRGIDPVTPMDVSPVSATGTDNAQPNPPSITPVTPGAIIVAAGTSTYTAVASYTTPDLENFRTTWTQSSGNQIAIGIGSADWSGSGAVNPAKWGGGSTNSGGCWCAWIMALRPA